MAPSSSNSPRPQKNAKARRPLALLAMAVILLGVYLLSSSSAPRPPSGVPLSSIIAATTNHQVKVLVIDDATQTLTATYRSGKKVASGYPLGYGSKVIEKFSDQKGLVIKSSALQSVSLLRSLLPVIINIFFIALLGFFLLRRMGGVGGKLPGMSSLKPGESVPATRFGDIGGVDEVVDEMVEIVDYLHHPDRYSALGAQVPHGVLLVGPPGTGKTLLAKAVAGEAGVPFFALSGSDFVETFVGVGARRVREVFARARKAGKAIVFIDELDAVGRTRSSGIQNGATEETDRTLNALLVAMDGFEDSNVIVLGATNRPEVLDSALLRSGRFDRKITIGIPDRRGRKRILELVTNAKTLASDVNLDDLAGRTSTMSGADLAFLANEAALEAARQGAEAVHQSHLLSALEVVAIGRARNSIMVSDHERQITAWHEAGHAVASLQLEAADAPVRVSIVPRGSAGGVTWMDADDRHFVSKSRALAQLVVLMAGRAGEMVLVGDDFTSGVASDLRVAGQLAKTMVTEWAMSDMGPHWSDGMDMDAEREVAGEVDRLLAQALADAQSLLETNAELHRRIADALLREDTLDRSDIDIIVAELAESVQ